MPPSATTRWRTFVLALGLVLLAPAAVGAQDPATSDGPSTAPTTATTAATTGRVTVAIKAAPPFVLAEEPRRGFSIDLWEEVASRAGFDTEYVWVNSVGEQLDAVGTGRTDAAIAAISITADREALVDFSTPIFNSGLQVLTRSESGVSISSVASALFSGSIGWLLIIMLALSLVMGIVVWLVERKGNPDFHPDARHGVFDGVWWAMVTMMTVGYGDRVPRRRVGRVLTILWMVVGVVLVANFTAVITTNLTLSQIRGEVTGLDEVESGKVAAVRGTTSESYLRDAGISAVVVDTAADAYAALDQTEVDAVVYDSPILRYYARTEGRGKVAVVGPLFDEEYYGIALPPDSPLAEPIDKALLSIAEDGTYTAIYERWFGTNT